MRPHDHLASAGDDVIVIDLGLRPEEPMMVWYKEKSSVTNRAGETIGFVDMNDGLRIHVYLRNGKPP
jgi:hypothetical protein